MVNTPQASKLARRWALDLRSLSADTEEFTRVRGINSFQPGLEPNMEDTTDFDNEGWTSQEKTMQGWSLTVGFIEKVGTDESRAQDPGQAILEAASDQYGADSMVEARWYERNGELAYQGIASVQYEPQGGSPTDLSTVNVTLQGNGARNRIPHPDAEGE